MKIDRTRLVRRGGGQRDARLFVIAPEGQTEKQYFEGLQVQGIVNRGRIKILVITDEDHTKSAPEHVLQRLDDFKQQLNLVDKLDQLWLVLDVDHWSEPLHRKNLVLVLQRARQKGYHVALSNPCFELWLLLHFFTDESFTDDIAAIEAQPTPHQQCDACEQRIRALCGSYNKARLRIERYTRERVEAAITRARAIDQTGEHERWPPSVGTQIHRLAAALLEQSRRNAFAPPAPSTGESSKNGTADTR